MSRDRLESFKGERVLVSATRDRISPAIEHSSKPKVLLLNVKVEGIGDKIDHIWVTLPRSMVSKRKDNIAFTAKVKPYLSLDKVGNHVTKMGLIVLKNIKIGKSRKHAVAMTKQSVESGKHNMLNKQKAKKKKIMEDRKVNEFEYNGFMGKVDDKVIMPYTATFKEWTPDPGIGKFECSDGETRYIPTFAIVDYKSGDFGEQEKTGVMFGSPSKS